MGSGNESPDRAGDLIGTDDERPTGVMERLRGDFHLAVVSLFGAAAMLGIVPFAVYRFLDGDWLTGTGDLVLVSLIGALVACAWWLDRARVIGTLTAVVMTAGFLLLVSFASISFMWAFPLLSASFLLADRYFAAGISVVVLVLLGIQPDLFASPVARYSFLMTAALVGFFSLIFATRTETQRRDLAAIAARDPLTGAGNRRALRRDLDTAVRVGRVEPISLALMDLDHFKEVNDACGHEAGDRVLVRLVALVGEHVRHDDRMYRLGGEEFVLLLPGTDMKGAERVVGKLHALLRRRLDGPEGPITVSIGAAGLRSGESPAEWLGRADEALYRAKRNGRDRVELAA